MTSSATFPTEASFGEYTAKMEMVILLMITTLKKKTGIEVDRLTAYQYITYCSEIAVQRIGFICDEEMRALVGAIMQATSEDCMGRFKAHLTGQFPDPKGRGFESPEAYGAWVEGAKRAHATGALHAYMDQTGINETGEPIRAVAPEVVTTTERHSSARDYFNGYL